MRSNHIVRIPFILVAIILIAFLLIGRLYYVQIVHGEEYSQLAERQYVRPAQKLYDRGSIFFEDKNGRLVSGATLKSGYTLAINPSKLEDPLTLYEDLSEIITIDAESFFFRANKKEDPYEEILSEIESEEAEKIGELDYVGVDLYRDRWRFYPGETLAAQTLGFVAFDDDRLTGVYGIERYYNDVLDREENNLYVNFFAEVFANLNKTIFDSTSQRAGDIVTSIEPSVQLFLETKLSEVQEAWGSKLTAGIVINPQNGEIFALGVSPGFDANLFNETEDLSLFSNPLVESVYEMGSIIKPLTMAAGIDSGAITPETTYYDNGFIERDGYTISNFDGKGRGLVPMQQVLNQSLNTGAAFVVGEMGNDVFSDYMRKYSIGLETGIDLPNESAGLVSNLNSPRDVEYATASFGQGIATTPIATVRALATLANGGVLITPHVAKKIDYENGLSKTISFNDGQRVLKVETSETITRMLVEVVDDALLNGKVKLENHSVAAKTGTAQIADPVEGGYYDDRFLHSFFGYFPAYDPRFLIFLYTVEPTGARYASQTLTEPFMDMVSFLTNYYSVPPDR